MTMKASIEFGFLVIALLLIFIFSIHCRDTTKPFVDINESETFSNVYGDPCRLNIPKDFPEPNDPQPLYIIPNTNTIWNPDRNGYLEIPKGSSIELFCSSSFANVSKGHNGKIIPKNTRVILATCIEGTTFNWRGEKYQFGEFVCKKQMEFLVERLNERCAKSSDMYRVGFNLTKDRFIEDMRICYDNENLRNHYTHHRLYPGSFHFQRYVHRLNFSKAGFLSEHNMNAYYTRQNQKKLAFEMFNSSTTVSTYFDDSELYLARGHLAAKSDFIYATQQRSTFTFFNVGPQWQSFNAGQWAAMEVAVRKYVRRMNLDVDCYTGTWGTLYLKSPNDTTIERPFYLATDKKKNGILPVPKLFYRIIIERNRGENDVIRGIALLGINNPHLSKGDIFDYIICKDIAADVPWLRWIRNRDWKKGYIYACSVAQLTQVIKVLPNHLRRISEILT